MPGLSSFSRSLLVTDRDKTFLKRWHRGSIGWVVLLALCLLPLGCSVEFPEGQLVCGADPADCPAELICCEGLCREPNSPWCVLEGGPPHRIDAGLDASTDSGLDADGDAGSPGCTTPASTTEIADLQVGSHHTCVLLADGTVHCWGMNDRGQLGDGTRNRRLSASDPAQANLRNVEAIALGKLHTCAISCGQIFCWGDNNLGQLGRGVGRDLLRDSTSPLLVPLPTGLRAIAIDSSEYHTCALSDLNEVYCWGHNDDEQVAPGSDPQLSPVRIELPVAAMEVAVGEGHTCALLTDGRVFCWGEADNGQLGRGTLGASDGTPTIANEGLGLIASRLFVGADQACIFVNNEAYCWGEGSSGSLGTGSVEGNEPVALLVARPIDTDWQWNALAIGHQGSDIGNAVACALGPQLYCWGDGTGRLLGTGSEIDVDTPQPVILPGGAIALDVALGVQHACAHDGNKVYCWGANSGGVGDGTTVGILIPTVVADFVQP